MIPQDEFSNSTHDAIPLDFIVGPHPTRLKEIEREKLGHTELSRTLPLPLPQIHAA